jgi:ATP-binding protein involved in chromosome partitioning
MMEMGALRELVGDTEWGALDVLLIDLPPGTDKLPNVIDVLPQVAGTIIVTLPSGVSQFVVAKSIKMAQEVLQTPIIGLVENMSAYVCTHCGEQDPLFPTGRVEALASEYDVPYLGGIPFDPRLAAAADAGVAFMQEYHATPAALALHHLAQRVQAFLE